MRGKSTNLKITEVSVLRIIGRSVEKEEEEEDEKEDEEEE